MRADEFWRMPLLLRPWQVMEVLGLDKQGLRRLREARPDIALRLPGAREWRYVKEKIAELAKCSPHGPRG